MKCQYTEIPESREKLIDQFFVLGSTALEEDKRNLIIPDCTPGLMYIERGSFSRKSGDELSRFSEGQLILFGQKTKSVEYIFDNSDLRAVGFKMMPQALYTLFGISAHEITDLAVGLDEINFNAENLIEDLLQGQISHRLQQTSEIPFLVNKVLEEIHNSTGLISIKNITDRYNIGYRRLQRLFKLHIGITPKLYSRIIRFNQSVNRHTPDNSCLTDVAYQSGYYDQNHFIKEAKAFTGMAPSNLFDETISGIEPDHLAYLKARPY